MLKNTGSSLQNSRLIFLNKAIAWARLSAWPSFNGYFLSCIVFNLLLQLLEETKWALSGEMWAEMGTNYFPSARASSYLVNFFATDAGYIPFPQRLIALLFQTFSVPAYAIPYAYTWGSFLLTGIIVGTFTLHLFRSVIRSDILRFLLSTSLLFISDFEVRTFINFTYFVAFLMACIAAATAMDRKRPTPPWVWCIPLLAFSKPSVMAALPAFVIVSWRADARFKKIAAFTALLCFIQIGVLAWRARLGDMPIRTLEIPPLEKLLAAIEIFFGYFAGYELGRPLKRFPNFSVALGVVLFFSCCGYFFQKRKKEWVLFAIGASILFFAVLLNCFALSDLWNTNLKALDGLPVDRHILVGFHGAMIALSAFICAVCSEKRFFYIRTYKIETAALFLFFWLLLGGWYDYGKSIGKPWVPPWLNASKWQLLSRKIDDSNSALCIPVNPFPWMYGRSCKLLNHVVTESLTSNEERPTKGTEFTNLQVPLEVTNANVKAVGIFIAPLRPLTKPLRATLTLTNKNSVSIEFQGEEMIPKEGGILYLNNRDSQSFQSPQIAKFEFSEPVEILYEKNNEKSDPAIMWMGII